jgi:acetoacetate decarboxylase
MSPEDVLKLPSMPASGPSFPAGPYRFIDREFMVISYETDPEVIRHQLRHDAALWPCAIQLRQEIFMHRGADGAGRAA